MGKKKNVVTNVRIGAIGKSLGIVKMKEEIGKS